MAGDDQSAAFIDADASFGEVLSVLASEEGSRSNVSAEAGVESGVTNSKNEAGACAVHETESGSRQEEEITDLEDENSRLGGTGLKPEIVSDDETTNSEVFERCAEILSEEDEIESQVNSETSDASGNNKESSLSSAAAAAAGDEKPQRRGVYKMPEANVGSLIFWPANFIILAVAWQVKLIVSVCSALASLLMFLYGLLVDPVHKSAEVKKQVSDQLNSQLKPVVTDLGPKLTGFLKRFGWGLLAVTYVGFVLSLLVVPVLLVEYFFVAGFIDQPLDITSPLYFNYAEARPSATLPLAPYLASGNGSRASSWYKLQGDVTLTLPESDYNRGLGMFQVAAEVLSLKEEILGVSSRPCMLRFQSPPIRYARTLIFSVPVLLDVTGEYQQLHLNLIELLQRDTEVVGSIRVVLQPRAGFPPGSGLPEIYSAQIRVRSELPWNKSLVYKWKRTIYVWTATVLFIGEVGFILCCFRQVLLPRRKKKPQQHRQTTTPVKKVRSTVKKRVSFQD